MGSGSVMVNGGVYINNDGIETFLKNIKDISDSFDNIQKRIKKVKNSLENDFDGITPTIIDYAQVCVDLSDKLKKNADYIHTKSPKIVKIADDAEINALAQFDALEAIKQRIAALLASVGSFAALSYGLGEVKSFIGNFLGSGSGSSQNSSVNNNVLNNPLLNMDTSAGLKSVIGVTETINDFGSGVKSWIGEKLKNLGEWKTNTFKESTEWDIDKEDFRISRKQSYGGSAVEYNDKLSAGGNISANFLSAEVYKNESIGIFDGPSFEAGVNATAFELEIASSKKSFWGGAVEMWDNLTVKFADIGAGITASMGRGIGADAHAWLFNIENTDTAEWYYLTASHTTKMGLGAEYSFSAGEDGVTFGGGAGLSNTFNVSYDWEQGLKDRIEDLFDLKIGEAIFGRDISSLFKKEPEQPEGSLIRRKLSW